ncbi:MAG: ATP-binding protein [Pseudomonadota bacterium]
MQRKLMEKLVAWKGRPGHMPLVVYGARQVGKTYLLDRFGKERFEDVVYVNFETDESLASTFSENIDPARLLNMLDVYFRTRIIPGKTLIVLDEIQACERALTSLKYFCEKAPEYDVVAAGSLLGVSVNRERHSFPVGKVELLTLHSLDFEEFLLALEEERLIAAIREAVETDTPLPELLHGRALEHYRTFLVVGGMPGVVNAYLREGRIMDARSTQHLILNSYVADMSKYATHAETTRIMACFDSIPAQLGKENRKFQYKVVRKGGSATLFGASIDWLAAAGIVVKCDKIEHGFMPPEAHRDLSSFKLYMSDAGLLTAKSGVIPMTLLSEREENTFAGAIAENFIAQNLQARGYRLYYWASNGQAEVDFLIQRGDALIPIEVKSGHHTRSRSLSVYREKYKPAYSIRLSTKQFGFENKIKSVPLYAVFCL